MRQRFFTVVVSLLAIQLALPLPVIAQSLRAAASAAAHDAAQASSTPTRRAPMSGAVKWTGLALLAGGTGLLVAGISKDNGCFEDEFAGHWIVDEACKDQAFSMKLLGGLVAGTGGGLLLFGALKRERVPTVTMRRGGVVVSQRITF